MGATARRRDREDPQRAEELCEESSFLARPRASEDAVESRVTLVRHAYLERIHGELVRLRRDGTAGSMAVPSQPKAGSAGLAEERAQKADRGQSIGEAVT